MTSVVVSYSGGIGSWACAKRLLDANKNDTISLIFADTFIEDCDLYRFLIESAAKLFGIQTTLHNSAMFLPPLFKIEERKQAIKELAEQAQKEIPQLTWIYDGRDLWQLFNDNKFISNNRVDACSQTLKRQLLKNYLLNKYGKHNFTLAIGIDWGEINRYERVKKNTKDYEVIAPLCDEPYLTQLEIFKQLEREGIRKPRAYEMGFVHNNCSNACVKAGKGQWAKLLKLFPDIYTYHENEEQLFQQRWDSDSTILRQTRNRETYNLSLKELREQIEGGAFIDPYDIGGCACAIE